MLIAFKKTITFQHRVLKRSSSENSQLQVSDAEYLYACMNQRCNKIKSFEILDKEPTSCYDQNVHISFDYTNILNETSKVGGYITQEKGAPILMKQLTTTECTRVKR